MKELSPQQKKIVKFIRDYTCDMDFSPTIYEIADYLQIKPPTAFAHINALQKKNIVQRTSKARSIKLIRNIKKNNKKFQIPFLFHPADIDDDPPSSQRLYYQVNKKYEKFKKDICLLKNDFDLKNSYNVMQNDILTLIRHPGRFILERGMLLLVWESKRKYYFTRYDGVMNPSYEIIAAVIELQRNI